MGIIGVDRSFTLVGPKRARIESEHYSFEIRVDWSHEIGDDCFDVLIGKKKEGKNVHTHLKIARDQSVIFAEPRDFFRTLGRKTNSKKRGQLTDETKVFDEKKPEGGRISFKVIIDEPTKTIRLDVSESRIREKREK